MKREHRKQKVLFIDSGGGYGGPSKFLYYLLKYLDRSKFDPAVVFYFYNDGPDTSRIKNLGVPVFFLKDTREPAGYVPVKWLLGHSRSRHIHRAKVALRFLVRLSVIESPLICKLKKLIEHEAINLVILNNDVHYHLIGTLGAKIAGAPCICRKAGGIGEGRGMKKFLTRHVDVFIAVSRATAEDQVRNNPATKRLVTISEGIDLQMYHSKTQYYGKRDELGIPASKKVVGNISRFDRGKGQTELLNAAALITGKYPEVVFLMVGDGELRRELQERARILNITDYVLFTGWRNDIAEILSITDIFVHCPTAIEGLGIANLEAMAMGKPSVVSDSGGLTDAVLDTITGFIVPPGDTERLSKAILKLLEDGELAMRLGKNARKRIEENFDIEKNIRKLEKLFALYV
ncbi:MAG: glycosyltransferase family 4 protein [Nitrospirae bacterium]|nr:glycosyltransferase family 4 protein [Nitrospirota bacterium]MCL5237686.1 glycosyltransferase family 4 protein [Nitrospirota bacterium]